MVPRAAGEVLVMCISPSRKELLWGPGTAMESLGRAGRCRWEQFCCRSPPGREGKGMAEPAGGVSHEVLWQLLVGSV